MISEKLEEAENFCTTLGLHKSFLSELYNEGSDWVFIIKTDALHETTCRELIYKSLFFKLPTKKIKQSIPNKFIQKLAFDGRSCVLDLLKESGCPEDHVNFIKAIRKIRNFYAHNIRNVELSIFELIKAKSKTSELTSLMAVNPKNYNLKDFLNDIEKDSKLLRNHIFMETLRFMTLSSLILKTE